MDLYPGTIEGFNNYFPDWRDHSIHSQELLQTLSVSASKWTTVHLEALRVLALPPRDLTFLAPYIDGADTLISQNHRLTSLLNILPGRELLLVPQHMLLNPTGPLFTFYNNLATVLRCPMPAPISSLDTVKDVLRRPSTSLPARYMTTEDSSSVVMYRQ